MSVKSRVVWGCVGLCIVVCNRVWANEREANLKGVNLLDIVAIMEEGGRLWAKIKLGVESCD